MIGLPAAAPRFVRVAIAVLALILAEVPNGESAWSVSFAFTIEPSPTPSLAHGARMAGISCPADGECWAALLSADLGTDPAPDQLAHWTASGGWTLEDTPASAEDVTCVSLTNCWAVGTAIQHWDGTDWTVTASPPGLDLRSVSCVRPTACWAVGGQQSSPLTPEIAEWDGSAWTVQDGHTGSTRDFLADVACRSINLCWAVGYQSSHFNRPQAIYEHWDGSGWTFLPTTDTFTQLNSVECRTMTDCWAVGVGLQTDSEISEPLTSHWTGTDWSTPQAQMVGTGGGTLDAVACLGLRNCWTAGYVAVGSIHQVLIEHGDGKTWSQVRAQVPTGLSGLLGLTCRKLTTGAGSMCKTSGWTQDPTRGTEQTLAETRTR